MTIDRVSLHQSGVFVCKASNSHGELDIQSTLDVQIEPKIKIVQSKFTVELQQTAVLPCRVSGLPTPTLVWERLGRVLVSSEKVILTFCSAVIQEISKKIQKIFKKYFQKNFEKFSKNLQIIFKKSSDYFPKIFRLSSKNLQIKSSKKF